MTMKLNFRLATYSIILFIVSIAHSRYSLATNFNNCTNHEIDGEIACIVNAVALTEYRFDEINWDGAIDEVKNSSTDSFHGRALGDADTISDGVVCRASSFDGNDDYINIDNIHTYLNSTASLSFWIKTSQSGGNRAWTSPGIIGVEEKGGGNDIFWGYLDNAGRLRFQKGNGSAARSNTIINDNNWHHVVLTRDSASGVVQVFVDGALEHSVNSATGDVSTVFSSIGRIESSASSASFIGNLDEFLVFDSVISADDVYAIYTNQFNEKHYDGSVANCETPPQQCEAGDGTLNAIGIKIDNGGSNSQINNTTEALSIYTAWLAAGEPETGLINNGTYNVAASGSSSVERLDFGGSTRDYSGTLPYPGGNNGVTGTDFLVRTAGNLSLLAGEYTIFVKSDDGFSFVMNSISGDEVVFNKFGGSSAGGSNELRYENPTGNSNTGGSFTLSQDSVFDIAAIFFERGGGDFLEISIINEIRNSHSTSDYEILRNGAIAGKVNFDQCITPPPPPPPPLVCELGGNTLNAVGIRIGNGGNDTRINNTSEALSIYEQWMASDRPNTGIIGNGTYNVAASGLSSVDRIDFGGSARDFSGTLSYPGASNGVTGTDFLVHTSGNISLPAGDYTIFVKSDDGFSFVMNRLSGDEVIFNKFGRSNAGGNNELRYENPTGNSNTGGSFTLTQDSVFDVAAIFFERGGGDFLEISIANDIRSSNAPSGYEILREGAINGKVKFGQCSSSQLHHYRIEHDTQGFTCEAETITIKACLDESCSELYDQETSIELSPSGWNGGNTLTFTGEISTNLSISTEGTYTFEKLSAELDSALLCFNGGTETCEMTFTNDGFEIYGANLGNPLPDQIAASNFSNVNVRAVRNVNNVCEALLVGQQDIILSYDCDSPNQCLTPLGDIEISGNGDGVSSGNITVEFDAQGVASLAVLNYPDAGRLNLSVAATVDGVTINQSDQEPIDIYPSYLAVDVAETQLIYGGVGNQNNYVAGEDFTFVIGAYGVNEQLLPNYQAESPQIRVTRVAPIDDGANGIFKYSEDGQKTSDGAFSNATSISSESENHFVGGEYHYEQAYYSEVGRITIDIRDADYLGNTISSKQVLTLGDFYPAYFVISESDKPELADTCSGTFSYLGENLDFATPPEFNVSAYNALDSLTENYSAEFWNYAPDQSLLESSLSFIDTSSYASIGTASVIKAGDTPLLTQNQNYDGSGTVSILNASFKYDKTNPEDDSAYGVVSPFDALLNLEFAKEFFSSTFVSQTGDSNTICYQANYADKTCLGWEIENITGTQIRYGRLTLESTFGPESEPLKIPIKTEYFDSGQWLVNRADNCTSIAFSQSSGQIIVTPLDGYNLDLLAEITSVGELLSGGSVGEQFMLQDPEAGQNGPGVQGKIRISLDPDASGVDWPNHLNFDWDGDGDIDSNDTPEAIATFGLFRSNDRIIQWREVF